MPYFFSAGVKLYYLEQGAGEPVIMIHGLASHAEHSWGATSWIERLSRNYRVLALDCRGHGRSERFYEPEAYSLEKVTSDVIALLDHAGCGKAHVLGYSMGGWAALGLAVHYQERLKSVVAGGTNATIALPADYDRIEREAQALISAYSGPGGDHGRMLLGLCRRTGNDPAAIAAFLRRRREGIDPAGLGAIRIPVLLVAGTEDRLSRNVGELQAMIPGARLLMLTRRNHMNAPVYPAFKDAVEEFFARH
jgi:pimeloyl-ACP methyl ester carboxylesterase